MEGKAAWDREASAMGTERGHPYSMILVATGKDS